MRYPALIVILLIFSFGFLFYSCQKWHDPKGYTDPRLTNPYCNDPLAVNYNWGFPGRPDDSVCYYPTDFYRGRFIYTDSIYLSDNTYSYSKVDTLWFTALSKVDIEGTGFCSFADSFHFLVDNTIKATLDTVVGGFGPSFCDPTDTVNGYITIDPIDSSLYHFNLTVNGTAGITYHLGSAIKG